LPTTLLEPKPETHIKYGSTAICSLTIAQWEDDVILGILVSGAELSGDLETCCIRCQERRNQFDLKNMITRDRKVV